MRPEVEIALDLMDEAAKGWPTPNRYTSAMRTIRAEFDRVTGELDKFVCSWCGNDFEPGDFASTPCCSCDPMPASGLSEALKSARREARDAIDEAESEEEGYLDRIRELEAERDALARRLRDAPLGGNGSHWQDCWRSHIDCAGALIDSLTAEHERLRGAHAELARCVLNGWTAPAFARGPLYERAVDIARAALAGAGT